MPIAKKPPVKPAKSTGTSIVKWDEELAKHAAIAKETTGAAGGAFLSVKSGQINYQGSPVPGNKLNVVVLDHIFENAFYAGKYDSNNPKPPVCFAFGRKDSERKDTDMAPHADSVEPQSESCYTCAHNVFGTADTGRGKACKNIRRLGLITEDALEDGAESVESAEVAYFKTPVTSGKAWDGLVRTGADTLHRPPFAFVTEISASPDSKTQFKVHFKVIDPVEDPVLLQALMTRNQEVRQAIAFPYKPATEEEEAPKPARGKAAPSKFQKRR